MARLSFRGKTGVGLWSEEVTGGGVKGMRGVCCEDNSHQCIRYDWTGGNVADTECTFTMLVCA